MGAVTKPILKAGVDESLWSNARVLRSIKAQCAKSFLRGTERLVVIAPHPDDEVLGAGGLIRLAHHFGVPTRLVLASDGEASHHGSRQISRVQLRFARVEESSSAFELLGGARRHIARLRFPDGQLGADEAELASAVSETIEPNDLVLTTWLRDGHPDHEACARAVRKATQKVGARLRYFPVWHWNFGKPDLSDLPRERMLRVPLTPLARLAKRCALSRFQTQRTVDPDVPDTPILPDPTLAYFERDFEVFLCA